MCFQGSEKGFLQLISSSAFISRGNHNHLKVYYIVSTWCFHPKLLYSTSNSLLSAYILRPILVEYLHVVFPSNNQKENALHSAEKTRCTHASAFNVVETSHSYGDVMHQMRASQLKQICIFLFHKLRN